MLKTRTRMGNEWSSGDELDEAASRGCLSVTWHGDGGAIELWPNYTFGHIFASVGW